MRQLIKFLRGELNVNVWTLFLLLLQSNSLIDSSTKYWNSRMTLMLNSSKHTWVRQTKLLIITGSPRTENLRQTQLTMALA